MLTIAQTITAMNDDELDGLLILLDTVRKRIADARITPVAAAAATNTAKATNDFNRRFDAGAVVWVGDMAVPA